MSVQIPSRPAMVLTTAAPEFAAARFVYNYYQKDEFVNYPQNYDLDKPPRLIELSFSSIKKILSSNVIGEIFNPLMQEILAQSDKITSEILLQSSGYIKYTSETERDYSFYLTSDLGSGENKQKIRAFFEQASNGSINGQRFADTPDSTGIFINASTGRPTSKSADIYSKQANESLIASDFCFDLIEASAANAFSIHSKKNFNDLRDLKQLQTRIRRRTNPALIDPNEYVMPVDFLDFANGNEIFTNLQNTAGMGIVAYVVFKQEINDLGEVIEDLGSIIITGLETSTYTDTQVKYGAKYKYNVHPLYIIKPDVSQNNVFAMIGAKGKSVKIRCLEDVPPPPLEAIQFRYKGDGNVSLSWVSPIEYGNIPDIPVNDIKGYQIFVRESYNEPFELKKYLTFNDMIGHQNFPLQENIPPKFIHRAPYHINNWLINLEKDRDYIVAMCVIDAHGNSSNLSPQYIVRVDSATNTVIIDFASYKGAPKQYPNMLMSNKIFLDCMKVSNKNKMCVYFCPEYNQVNLSHSTGENPPDSVSVLPDSTTNVPSYRIQLINVTKQADKIVDVFINPGIQFPTYDPTAPIPVYDPLSDPNDSVGPATANPGAAQGAPPGGY